MTSHSAFSPQLRSLIGFTEQRLGIEVILHRQADCPPGGILLDSYTYLTDRNVIVYPAALLGLLKDFVIAHNVVRLLIRGEASCADRYQVLSYEPEGVIRGMKQIYLDLLKDEQTRSLPLAHKRKIPFYLYKLFHDTLSDIPWSILSHTFIAKNIPAMRNAQVYFLLKESLRDMHELVEAKNYIPRKYFVMHNGMFYARDMLLSSLLSEFKLNPLINIPEMQRFKNLDVKEMMTHRWSQSHWYYTKLVGDTLFSALSLVIPPTLSGPWNSGGTTRVYDHGCSITNNFMALMNMPDWYVWRDPAHLRTAEENQARIMQEASSRLFGE
ncbi:hypothetical protein ASZ90_015175 [hydrocarbon metagenome]|uniref:Uncharacterized protein n=1 Tax=hydrocarbon metagenome TaxID=938273 RepID=A0A0W8F372_9ZZZZ